MAGENLDEPLFSDVKTIVSSHVFLQGRLEFSTQVRIDGRFEGDIISESGSLIIGKDAEVVADIQVFSLVLEGKLKGRVSVREDVFLREGSELYADVKTKRLLMDDRVVFEGKCEMLSSPGGVDIFAASVSQLKDSLQSD